MKLNLLNLTEKVERSLRGRKFQIQNGKLVAFQAGQQHEQLIKYYIWNNVTLDQLLKKTS